MAFGGLNTACHDAANPSQAPTVVNCPRELEQSTRKEKHDSTHEPGTRRQSPDETLGIHDDLHDAPPCSRTAALPRWRFSRKRRAPHAYKPAMARSVSRGEALVRR